VIFFLITIFFCCFLWDKFILKVTLTYLKHVWKRQSLCLQWEKFKIDSKIQKENNSKNKWFTSAFVVFYIVILFRLVFTFIYYFLWNSKRNFFFIQVDCDRASEMWKIQKKTKPFWNDKQFYTRFFYMFKNCWK
jgi:hypothetical protein